MRLGLKPGPRASRNRQRLVATSTAPRDAQAPVDSTVWPLNRRTTLDWAAQDSGSSPTRTKSRARSISAGVMLRARRASASSASRRTSGLAVPFVAVLNVMVHYVSSGVWRDRPPEGAQEPPGAIWETVPRPLRRPQA